jgi:hypothetical protein
MMAKDLEKNVRGKGTIRSEVFARGRKELKRTGQKCARIKEDEKRCTMNEWDMLSGIYPSTGLLFITACACATLAA